MMSPLCSCFISKMLCGMLVFSLSIVFPTLTAERDCNISDGYIRDNQANVTVTENCDQECGWMQCGDVCINAWVNSWCYCSGVKLELYSAKLYCCVDQSSDQKTQCSVNRYGWGNCPHGRVISKRDTCNNHCFNDYETSAAVGEQSRYRCGEKCFSARFMCRGYHQCSASRDVIECDEDLKCVLNPEISVRRHALVSNLSVNHHYCYYENTHNDGKYDTITREDETDLNILSSKVKIDYTSIYECNTATKFNLPGLMCGDLCGSYRVWCLEDHAASCGKYNFSTNNKQLCANTTFWSEKSCDLFFNTRRKGAVGRRCTGATQHCSYPWYTSIIKVYEVSISLVNETFF